MSLLHTFNPDYQLCDYISEQIKGVLPDYITWNHESYNVMYNVVLLTLSCFTWCYFITFMTMKLSVINKKVDDLMLNVISLFAGYLGILIFGYYNFAFESLVFIISILLILNLQMLFTNNFNMIEYAVINAFLTTIINIGIFLLLLYKMPFNVMINLHINVGKNPIFTMNETN